MRNILKLMFGLVIALGLVAPGWADEKATKEDAVAMVKKAVAFYKKNGRDAAVTAANDQGPDFRKGELFVVIVDPSGKAIGHAALKKMIGANIMELKDTNGVFMVKDIFEKAKKSNSGWSVEYLFTNPATQAMAPKLTYFEKVDDLIFFCGVYK